MRRILFFLCLLPLTVSASEPTNTQPDIIHTSWYCPDENISRRVDIYIPSNVQRDNVQCTKVLYLIHGINGYEGSWTELGHAPQILDSMIAVGACEPVILIMPDCNKWIIKERPCHKKLWKSVVRYPFMSHEHQIERSVSVLIDSIDSLYHPVSSSIAGLSDGARIAANIANYRPDYFTSVGLFSPVLYKAQLPQTTSNNLKPCQTTSNYYIYVGKQDFLKPNGKRFHKRLLKQNFPHEFIELRGKHNWSMWQQCLIDFLKYQIVQSSIVQSSICFDSSAST